MRVAVGLGLACSVAFVACGGGSTPVDAAADRPATMDIHASDVGNDTAGDLGDTGATDVANGADVTTVDASLADTAAADGAACDANLGGDAGVCYTAVCPGTVHTLQDNRDRLIADLARRKCTDACTLWASLNLAERYIFLMDTAYFGAPSSRLYPPSFANLETALDHATALYSINGPMAGQGVDGSGRGGNDYNRIYLGFDSFAACVMRNFHIANPTMDANYNQWQTSDDVAGPHAPFTQREMIYWYKAFYDLQSEGPQFHHWHQDSDFDQAGIDARLGVCGNMDRTLVESTIAFDAYHNSDPLGDYSGRGGYGWQIVSMYVGIDPNWAYMPTGCPMTAPVNTDPYGGGTFNGMGPVQADGGCTSPTLGDAGSCAYNSM